MGKLIPFAPKNKTDKEAVKLIKMADAIDAIVLEAIDSKELDPEDVAAVLAHRLGTFLNHIDEKISLWEFCEKVLRKQAALDEIS